VCANDEQCAKGEDGRHEMVYACAPVGVTDGFDSRIRVTVTSTSTTGTGTGTGTGTVVANATLSGNGNATTSGIVQPTSGTGRLQAPHAFKILALIVRSVSANFEKRSCCGDLCCPTDEVCTRSSAGPKCWPQAGAVEKRHQKERVCNEEMTPEHDDDTMDEEVKVEDVNLEGNKGVGARGGGGIPAAHPGNKSDAAGLSVVLLFVTIACLVAVYFRA